MKLRTIWSVLKETGSRFAQGPTLSLSAATAYYSVFSIAPLLVLVMGLAGVVFGEQQVRQEIRRQLQSYVGERSTHLIESMMSAQIHGGSLMATIVGAVALVFGATAVFSQLQDGLNTIWGVTARPGNGLWIYVRDRLLSMAMLLGIGFLLLVSMALSAFVNAFTHYIGGMISVPDWMAPLLESLVSFVITSFLFALLLKVLPDVQIRWRDVWVGAAATALLFSAGKFLLGYYLGHEMSISAYGAGSAFIVILLYVYYASVVVFLGAEFTRSYTLQKRGPVRTAQYAVARAGRQSEVRKIKGKRRKTRRR